MASRAVAIGIIWGEVIEMIFSKRFLEFICAGAIISTVVGLVNPQKIGDRIVLTVICAAVLAIASAIIDFYFHSKKK